MILLTLIGLVVGLLTLWAVAVHHSRPSATRRYVPTRRRRWIRQRFISYRLRLSAATTYEGVRVNESVSNPASPRLDPRTIRTGPILRHAA